MSSTNEGNLVTIRQTGVKDIRRALRGLEARALTKALAEVRRAVDQAAAQGVETIKYVIDTSGAGMPYKHDKNTDARVHTGAMRESVGVRWERDDNSGVTVFIGFINTPDYTVFQEEGTHKLRAMQALAKARAMAEDDLDSIALTHGVLK